MAYYILRSYKLKVNTLQLLYALSAQKCCFFLDSSLHSRNVAGRYSFLGAQPFAYLKTRQEEPFSELKDTFALYRVSVPRCPIPFLGGGVGYFSYDLGVLLENKIRPASKEKLGLWNSFFALYNTVIIVDHFEKQLHIFSVGFPERKYHLAKALCEENIKKITALIADSAARPEQAVCAGAPRNGGLIEANCTKAQYLSMIQKAKEYIRQGDIYQVNLSQRLSCVSGASAVETYRRLRTISPSSFGAYFDAGDFQILSSSPERFLRLGPDNRVVTTPMKGTRERSPQKTRDRKLRASLLGSAKDKAELVMIVDLERNDLGRVCEYGSVRVTTMRRLERYNTVFQTTATIEGKLRKNKDRFDVLRACFPGGSVTGCPKIRAMEIIEELEPTRRFVYTGSLGYLSFSGPMDFNILIRSIIQMKNRIHFWAGGGIVADSDPEAEYEETLIKARAMMRALGAHFNA